VNTAREAEGEWGEQYNGAVKSKMEVPAFNTSLKKRNSIMAAKKRKTSPKAQETVKRVMEEFKEGELESGKTGKKVKSKKQAVAIGLSEARKAGKKVAPKKRKAAKKSVKKAAPKRKKATTKRKAAVKRTVKRKATKRSKKA
jgi:hypothetical protein